MANSQHEYGHYTTPLATPAFFGYDLGKPDHDLPNNKDREALDSKPRTPPIDSPLNMTGKDFYYAKPIAVYIPAYSRPIPSTLLENPMNLVYFHYFIDYTAKSLVTLECSTNPFRTILPQMALEKREPARSFASLRSLSQSTTFGLRRACQQNIHMGIKPIPHLSASSSGQGAHI